MTKREFINQLLELNDNMKKVGTSDVWMGEPTMKGLKLVNMTVKTPFGASYEAQTQTIISSDGIKVKLWRP